MPGFRTRSSILASCLAVAPLSPSAGCAKDGTASVQPSFSANDEAAVRAVLESQRNAWNAGDLDGYMAGYEASEALVFTSGAQVRRGWETTRDKYRARYGEDPSTMGKLAFEILEVRGLGSEAAVVLGRWILTETPESGEGIFSVILLRGEAGWKVVHDHTSALASNADPSPD